jgi:glycine hydroxymethyltransferase
MTTTHKTLRGPRGGMILTSEEFGKKIDKSVFPGMQGGPLMHVIAGKAVAFGEALKPEFKVYAQSVIDNARAMAKVLESRGFPIISGGTDTHLFLINVDAVGLSGRQAEKALDKVGITVNKNTIPGETRSPMQASGIRIGSPAITTRGFTLADAERVAHLVADVLLNPDDEGIASQVVDAVAELTQRYPLPGLGVGTIQPIFEGH